MIGFWEANGWSETNSHPCNIKDGRWMDRKHFSIGFGSLANHGGLLNL
jgi:hypothetical protein